MKDRLIAAAEIGVLALVLQGCGDKTPATPSTLPSNSPIPTAINSENPTIVIPTATPTPETTPTPDLTFPGDLTSWEKNEIHVKNVFSSNTTTNSHLDVNLIGDPVKETNSTYDQIQGYELGAEVVDGNLVNYVGLKDGSGSDKNQFVLAYSYGPINGSDEVMLDLPRTAFSDPNEKPGKLISVSQMKDELNANVGNNIIFDITSYKNLKDIGTAGSAELRNYLLKQSPQALKLMQWLAQTKTGSWQNIPMDPDVAKVINTRITAFDPNLLTDSYFMSPYKKSSS